MSKIGDTIISVPQGVAVDISARQVTVKGSNPNDTLTYEIPRHITIENKDGQLVVARSQDAKKTKSLHGLFRSLVANAVSGVQKPWEKKLEIVGTGYNVKLQGEDIVLKVGYSHLVTFEKVDGVKYQVQGNNKVIVSGIDKQLVGQVAHQIRIIRKPDAYKGKGIRYEGERVKVKPGKKAKSAGE